MKEENTDLNPLFKPRSIAHVGASANEVVGRFNFTYYLLQLKFKGNIYPVNPKYDEICGLKCYSDLNSIPEDIDIAILAIPAKHCASALQSIPKNKIKFVIIHTSGFGEIDRDYLEEELIELSREKGFRIVGPNCMGVYSQQGRTGFWMDHYEIIDKPGTIGAVSQSGGHAINSVRGGMNTGTYYDKVVSVGNQIDISINELFKYYIDDSSIKVIGLYIEQIHDGRLFLKNLDSVIDKKPVVVWKGGISEIGKAASETHTGSIAGNERIFSSAMRQAGVIMADNREEYLQLLRLLQPQYDLPHENIAVISPGGGNTVNICDIFAAQPDINLPRFTDKTQEKLKAILPEENTDLKNPVDSGGSALTIFEKLFKIIGEDPNIGCILALVDVDFLGIFDSDEQRLEATQGIISIVKKSTEILGKPIHLFVIQHRPNYNINDGYRRLFIDKLIENDIPWFIGSFKETAATYSKLVRYRKFIEKRKSKKI